MCGRTFLPEGGKAVRKVISLIAAAALMAGSVGFAYAENVISPIDAFLITPDGTITGCTSGTYLQISNDINGVKVKKIGDRAFQNTAYTGLSCSDGLTEIGAYAFADSDLYIIDIPETVTRIGEGAFKNCKNLEKIYFRGDANDLQLAEGCFEGTPNSQGRI